VKPPHARPLKVDPEPDGLASLLVGAAFLFAAFVLAFVLIPALAA
jgi:hypothetical protein